MKNMKYLMAVVLFTSFFFTGCKEKPVSPENDNDVYLDIAKEVLVSMNISIDEGELLFDENNLVFNKHLEGVNNPDFSILKDRQFQAVLYYPKTKKFSKEIQFGGEVWVFIDTETKKVIYVFQGK